MVLRETYKTQGGHLSISVIELEIRATHTHKKSFFIPRGIPSPALRGPIIAPIRFISRTLRGRARVTTTRGLAWRSRLRNRRKRTRSTGAILGIIRRGKRLGSRFDGHQVAHGIQARFRNTRNVRNRSLQRWYPVHQKITNATLGRRGQIGKRWKSDLQSRGGPVPITGKIFVLRHVTVGRESPRPPWSI